MRQPNGKPVNTSKLLIEEEPLQVLPALAVALGLNEAIALQQLHYWLRKKPHHRDGRDWHYNRYVDWQQQFPFWSISTIKRTMVSLEKSGVVITANYNNSPIDKTKWYTINYDKLNSLHIDSTAQNEPSTNHSEPSTAQNEPSRDQVEPSMAQNEPLHGSDWPPQFPETNTETTDKDLNPPPLPPQGEQNRMGVGVEVGQDTTAVLFNQPAILESKTVLAYLNKVTGCGFQDLGEIPNCLAAGGTVEECILVIDWWDARWTKSNPRQRQYFDTNTPFAVKNFDRYRGKAKKWESEGRPAWVAEDDAAPVTYVSRDQVRQDAVFSNMPSLKERAMAHEHRRHGQVLPSPEDARGLLPRHTD